MRIEKKKGTKITHLAAHGEAEPELLNGCSNISAPTEMGIRFCQCSYFCWKNPIGSPQLGDENGGSTVL